jgi:hypothetical protein
MRTLWIDLSTNKKSFGDVIGSWVDLLLDWQQVTETSLELKCNCINHKIQKSSKKSLRINANQNILCEP